MRVPGRAKVVQTLVDTLYREPGGEHERIAAAYAGLARLLSFSNGAYLTLGCT
jgi:hypothetical protein